MKHLLNIVPFPSLDPVSVLPVVESLLGQKLGGLFLQRNSYINRVFEVETQEKARLILKFYRPGRWSEAQLKAEHRVMFRLAELEIPVVCPNAYHGRTLLRFATFGEQPTFESLWFAVYPKVGGRGVDEFGRESLEAYGRTVGRMHLALQAFHAEDRGCVRPGVSSRRHIQELEACQSLPVHIRNSFFNVANRFIEMAEPMFENVPMQWIHGDLHRGNLVYRQNDGIYIFDWDDCCAGPRIQDVWMIFDSDEPISEMFWRGYEQYLPAPYDQIRLIPVLRRMRQLHFAAWCAVQTDERQFQSTFPDWGNATYWRQLHSELESGIIELERGRS